VRGAVQGGGRAVHRGRRGVRPGTHGLSRDELASVNFYTKENLGDSEQSFFRKLNKAFNAADRSKAKPFFSYLKLFVQGARKLPNGCPAKLWRAFPNLDPEWATLYPKDKELFWWAFSSTTKSSEVLTNPAFFGEAGERTLFMLDCVSGIDISEYSDFPEDEVLLMPGSKFVAVPQREGRRLGGGEDVHEQGLVGD
jgi:hypothetical protein